MPSPAEIRLERLANDYKEMQNIQGSMISWRAKNGIAPYIDEYEITINVRSIINATPTYREQHRIVVILPANYPNAAPNAKMIDRTIVFHPNWWPDGRWCYGTWDKSEFLGHFVLRLIKTLQYDCEITNENSPANSEAKEWYVRHKGNTSIFPCDRQNLPDPTKKRYFAPKNASTFEPRAIQLPNQDEQSLGFFPRQ